MTGLGRRISFRWVPGGVRENTSLGSKQYSGFRTTHYLFIGAGNTSERSIRAHPPLSITGWPKTPPKTSIMLRGGGKKVPILLREVFSRKEIVYHPRKTRNPSSMADLTSLAQALSLYTICTSHNHSIFLNGVRSGVCFDCKPQIRPQILRRTLDGDQQQHCSKAPRPMLHAIPPQQANRGFRWRGKMYHLTYKGHIPRAVLLARLASISSIKVLGTSCVHEASDVEVPTITHTSGGCGHVRLT